MRRPPVVGAPDERSVLVQAKFKELLREAGVDPDHPENWKLDDYATRYQCMAQAEREVPGGSPPVPADGLAIEGDPHEALAAAQRDLATARADVAKARQAADRASARRDKAEADLAQYASLDDEIEEAVATAIRDDTDDTLPTHLAMASRDRAIGVDRLDHAIRAERRLASELRNVEANCEVAEKRVKAIASVLVMQQAEELAHELAEVEAKALALQERLLALAHSFLPSHNGAAMALPASVVKAINDPKPVPEKRDALVSDWRSMHAMYVNAVEF